MSSIHRILAFTAIALLSLYNFHASAQNEEMDSLVTSFLDDMETQLTDPALIEALNGDGVGSATIMRQGNHFTVDYTFLAPAFDLTTVSKEVKKDMGNEMTRLFITGDTTDMFVATLYDVLFTEYDFKLFFNFHDQLGNTYTHVVQSIDAPHF